MLRQFKMQRRRLQNLRQVRAVLTASRHMRDEYLRHQIPADRLHVVPLFPPGAVRDVVPPEPRPARKRILFVGRITALKGWRHLLEAIPLAAAALGRTLTLVVAGDGPDRSAFEAEAKRRNIPAEFLGWVDAERRNAEMRTADVLAVPSVWPEPFGLVGIEAGCVGLPSVAFAVGGIPDWLLPGVSGELAPGERPNPRDLADALVRALADRDHWQRLRVGAWETAGRFTLEAHLERLLPILRAAADS
jgi:glycosyltransferase involved in cell wall biosynthesis